MPLTASELQTLRESSGDDCDMTAVECCVREILRWRSGAETELAAANAAIEDLNVQCKFWRQAAEHAVKGWNALEDKVEAAKEALDAIEHNTDAVRELLGSSDEWAPPDIVAAVDHALSPYASYELEPGVKLRVVEDETPIKGR